MSFSSIRAGLRKISEPYPWGFIAFILAASLVPKLYDLSNTYWIGHVSFQALAITEQYEFLAVIIEIVNETVPYGALALVAQNYRNREKSISVVKAGLVVQLAFSAALALAIFAFTPQFVSTIGTPPEIVDLTTRYLFLKAIALPFSAVATLLLIAIKSLRRGRDALLLVLVSVALNMALDLLLISDTGFSLRLGVEGSAIGYVASQVVLAAVTSLFLARILRLRLGTLLAAGWRNHVRPLFAIGGWTGLDSLVRNAGYILVPLNVLNVIGTDPYGGYGLAMTVMWTLIIPVLAITEATNVVVGNCYGEGRYSDLKKTMMTSLVLVAAIMLAIAAAGALFWGDLSAFFNMNPVMVGYSVATFNWLIVPYIIFGLDMVLKSVFVGTGRTKYIFAVSAIENFGLIFPFWALSRLGVFPASFDNVMLLFAVVFATDIAIAYFFVRRLLNRMQGTPKA